MHQLRQDPISGRWVIVSKSRAERPNEFQLPGQPRSPCPFCDGNESETPGEVLAYRSDNTRTDQTGWRVRVVPNKYPALVRGEIGTTSWEGTSREASVGFGVHDVIIESPEHLRSTSELSLAQLHEVLWSYRDRIIELKRDHRLQAAIVFKNVGAAAGASLEHTHSQLIAMPMLPSILQEELTSAREFIDRTGRCIFCEMIDREIAQGSRLVLQSSEFVSFCPFASRFSLETWILPKRHESHYENLSPPQAEELSQMLREIVSRIEAATDRPAYNYFIHSAPFNTADEHAFHWHLEIAPRLSSLAGFECGGGNYINAVPPEEAAALLRGTIRA